ncbi:MAG: Rne/Rng family ribonuclease [Syntrophomonadaceae bacterium]|nr:Rne/Rng family ribonuclease [Syntrophomonadaceae bacterium]
MVKEIIAEVYPWESRVGIVEDGRLAEVFWADQSENVGNIYKGKVKDVLPGLSCAFIDIGLVKNAFLYAGDVVLPGSKKGVNGFDLLKSGQDIMVQVKKEAFAEKGARVTGDLTIPGRYLVLLPFQNEVSISRKITDDGRRKHLRSIIEEHKPHGTGLILRTACLEAEDHEIIGDLRKLIQIWEEINWRYNNHKSASLIYEDIDVLERTLRDYLDASISRVIINNLRLRERIVAYMDKQKANNDINIQFQEGDLFEKYGLEKDIRRSLRRKVWLKSGGYLIFDNTEAMTVIDVNSGKFTGKDDFEETIFKINVEAALEIPRQLRLRSLGGIILIDFIDMKDKINEEQVINSLRHELEKDKAHTRIIGMTGLGFLEMTRKKSRYGVVEFFTDECSTCSGKGYTINLLALSCEVKRKLANMGYVESEEIVFEANPCFLKLIKDDEKNLTYIEKRTGKKIKLAANPNLDLTEYKINAGSS